MNTPDLENVISNIESKNIITQPNEPFIHLQKNLCHENSIHIFYSDSSFGIILVRKK